MLYVNYVNIRSDGFIGIRKKVLAQCRTFKKAFGIVYYTIFAGTTMYLLHDDIIVDKEFAIAGQMTNDVLLKWLIKYDIKRVYIRYNLADMWFVNFLKEIKRMNIRGVLEFPTIPYDGEGWIRRPIEDKYYREQLHEYINCCTTYSDFEAVFDIPCISLTNGVDINEHRVKKQIKKNTDEIILMAVATMRREHGYERVLTGLYEYYTSGGKRKIYLNLVGDGGQIQYYKQLVMEYELNEYVTFHGYLQGEALDEVYDLSDLSIGGLGAYKSGIFSGVGIKAAEYCVRGLPMIMVDDYGFKDKYFVLKVPNDNTAINMDTVIAFYDSLQNRDYVADMRNYGVENYSWDKILEPVVEYLK